MKKGGLIFLAFSLIVPGSATTGCSQDDSVDHELY